MPGKTKQPKKKKAPDSLKKTRAIAGILLIVALVMIFVAPYIFTRSGSENVDFRETGQIGDTIGGIVGPIINAFSAILIFLSFYQQVKANNILSKQVVDQKKSDYLSKVIKQLEKIVRKMYFSEEVIQEQDSDKPDKPEPQKVVEPVGMDKYIKDSLPEFKPIEFPPFTTTVVIKGFELLQHLGSNLHQLYSMDSERFYLVFSSNIQRELLHFLRVMKNISVNLTEEDSKNSAEVIQLIYWQESYLDAIKDQLEKIKEKTPYKVFDPKIMKSVDHVGPELAQELLTDIGKMIDHLITIKQVIDPKSKEV